MALIKKSFILLLILAGLSGCFRLRSSNGGGEIKDIVRERQIDAEDVALPEGYKIEVVATGLTYPTGIAFDAESAPYITESGYAYGEEWTEPKLIKIHPDGTTTTIASGKKNGPWNGLYYYDNEFFVSEGGQAEGGRILKIDKEGTITTIAQGLPGYGDHHTNGPVVKDGYIYFGQGTATNSGVVGVDNMDYGWLSRHPEFHDLPCKDIVLAGVNYVTGNVLDSLSEGTTSTGAYSPYGVSSTPGQQIKGVIPCSGAVMRVPVEGGELELIAWGLRNPYGLGLTANGELFVTENAFDVRGSRPVWGTGDVLWKVEKGKWYGWPDFSAGQLISANKDFTAPGEENIQRVLKEFPDTPPKPAAILGVHSSSNGFDFSSSADFGYVGEAFIAQFGDMAPQVGKVLSPVGFKIVRVAVNTGVISDFAVNKGKRNGPASWLKKGGLERPVAAKFDPTGNALYIVDFGIMKVTKEGSEPVQNSGVVWKITPIEND